MIESLLTVDEEVIVVYLSTIYRLVEDKQRFALMLWIVVLLDHFHLLRRPLVELPSDLDFSFVLARSESVIQNEVVDVVLVVEVDLFTLHVLHSLLN